MRFLAPDNLFTARPSFSSGFARNASQSAYPHLWDQLKGLWCPSMGVQGRGLIDFSGYGHNGVFSTGMGDDAWIPSPWGWALKYDGTDDCINLGVNIVDMNTDFTILARARLDDLTHNTYSLVGASVSGSGASGYFMLIQRADKGSGYVFQYDTGPGAAAFGTSPTIAAVQDKWHTIVLRRMGNGMLIFQDDYVTVSDGTNPTFSPSTTQNWGIGTYDPINNIVLFKGQIGDVMIWNRGLSPREMELVSQGYAHPLTLADKFTFAPPHVSGSALTAGGMMLLGVGG